MKLSLPSIFASLTVLPLAAHAESVVQSAPFSVSKSYTGSGTELVADQTFFAATMHPFNAALGRLDSFTIEWEVNGTLKGTVAAGDQGGTAEGSLGGTYSFNDVGFNGNGGANGTGAGPGGAIDAAFTTATAPFSQTFLAVNAGVTYNPALLEVLTGGADFTASWNSAVTAKFTNMALLDVAVTGKVTLTYNYTPAVPLEFTGITRNPATKAVTVMWKSDIGKVYAVQASDDMKEWVTIAPIVLSEGEQTDYTDDEIPAGKTSRFYRVKETSLEGLAK